jgi:hypothetical protein
VLAMMLLLLLLVGVPPVVQGAFAFGHIVAMTLPDDVSWGALRIPIGLVTMSRVDSIPG